MTLRSLILAAAATAALAVPAQAGCYADYRAQQTNPVRFHYGVARVSDSRCEYNDIQGAAGELAGRLARDGWTLVNVLSTFGDDQLASRRANAGQYFLRY